MLGSVGVRVSLRGGREGAHRRIHRRRPSRGGCEGGVSCGRIVDLGCGQGLGEHTWLALTFRGYSSVPSLNSRDTVALVEPLICRVPL